MKRQAPKTVFTGRVFRVEQEVAALPGGRSVRMDIVRHPGSVVIIPQPAPGKVILIRQYRHVLKRWIWELPAGTLDEGESPRHGARRECEEEIGLRPQRLERVGFYYPTPGFCDESMAFYLCRELVVPKRPAALDEDEQIEPRTFSLQAAWRLVRSGQVVDMKTVLGLAMLAKKVPLVGATTRG